MLMVMWMHNEADLTQASFRGVQGETGSSSLALHALAVQSYQWLEFYAGLAEATEKVRARGYAGCKFDIIYNEKIGEEAFPSRSNFMDINDTSGFAPRSITKGRQYTAGTVRTVFKSEAGSALHFEVHARGRIRRLVRDQVFVLG